jgi:hypothetical protein
MFLWPVGLGVNDRDPGRIDRFPVPQQGSKYARLIGPGRPFHDYCHQGCKSTGNLVYNNQSTIEEQTDVQEDVCTGNPVQPVAHSPFSDGTRVRHGQ